MRNSATATSRPSSRSQLLHGKPGSSCRIPPLPRRGRHEPRCPCPTAEPVESTTCTTELDSHDVRPGGAASRQSAGSGSALTAAPGAHSRATATYRLDTPEQRSTLACRLANGTQTVSGQLRKSLSEHMLHAMNCLRGKRYARRAGAHWPEPRHRCPTAVPVESITCTPKMDTNPARRRGLPATGLLGLGPRHRAPRVPYELRHRLSSTHLESEPPPSRRLANPIQTTPGHLRKSLNEPILDAMNCLRGKRCTRLPGAHPCEPRRRCPTAAAVESITCTPQLDSNYVPRRGFHRSRPNRARPSRRPTRAPARQLTATPAHPEWRRAIVCTP